MKKDSRLFWDIIHKICQVHTNPMLDLTPKMLKLIRIPKVWKTMCKGQLHWACFCHVMACQWKCISMSSRFWSRVPMSSELQGWAILLSQQTSHFVQYPTYYIVLQFPGLSITLNRADKAHCSSCLEPKTAFREPGRSFGAHLRLWERVVHVSLLYEAGGCQRVKFLFSIFSRFIFSNLCSIPQKF